MSNLMTILPALLNDTNNATENPCSYLCKTSTIAKRLSLIFSNPSDSITVVLCLVGICANGMSILAVSRLPSKTTHLKLIISLCVSDALILTGVLLYYIMFILRYWQTCTGMILRLITEFAVLATLINLLMMAIDHYLATMKPLRYKQKMTHFLGCCIVFGVWLACLFVITLEILINLSSWHDRNVPFCYGIEKGNYKVELFIISFIFTVLLGIVWIYGKIYILVRKVQKMPNRQRARSYTDSSSTKALITTLLFVSTFIICWAPKGIYALVMYIILKKNAEYVFENDSISMTDRILSNFVYLSAVADPIIYAVRLPNVRRGFVAIFSSSSKESVTKGNKTSTYYVQSVCTLHTRNIRPFER